MVLKMIKIEKRLFPPIISEIIVLLIIRVVFWRCVDFRDKQ